MKKISVFITAVVAVLLVGLLVSCNNSKDITGSLKLTYTESQYKGSDFVSKGVGDATVVRISDGDTATFDNNGKTITIRFDGIDTPESTGKIEKWGKAASNFVKDKLNNTTQVVLDSETVPAQVDSYGSRYIGFVWYLDAETNEFRNLNLEVVENGFSDSKLNPGDKYYEYFKDAEAKAKKEELHIWSDDDDPLFNTDYVEATLSEVLNNKEEYLDKNVILEAYITSIDNDGYIYIANDVDGEIVESVIYDRPTTSLAALQVGNKVSFAITFVKYGSGYQFCNINIQKTKLVTKGYYLQFGTDRFSGFVYDNIIVSNLEVKGDNLVIYGTSTKLGANGLKVNVTLNVPNSENNNIRVGSKIKVNAYTDGIESKETNIVANVLHYDDIKIV